MSHFIMLIGLPGSGKSHWRNNFLQDDPREWTVVSSDDIIEEECRKVGCTYSEGFERFANYANKEMKRRAQEAFQRGDNVIWDQTNMSRKSRKNKIKMAEGYMKEAIVFSIPDTLLQERLTQRPDKQIPGHVLDKMARSYEAPTREEGFDQVFEIKE